MKAMRYHRLGGPEVLCYEDVPDPVPPPGEVEVLVRAISVSPIHWKVAKGVATAKAASLPNIPGSECAGQTRDGRHVVLVGGGFGTARQGVYAEKITASPDNLVDVPEGVSFAEAAALGVAYLTAYLALHTRAGLKPGERVAVLGATGGVGVAAVQIAKLAGAKQVVAVGRPDAHAQLRELGADVTLDAADAELGAALQAATGGVEVILDPVAGAVGVRAMAALVPFGRQVVLGTAAGETITLPVPLLYGRNGALLGFSLFGFVPQLVPTMKTLLAEVAAKRLRVPIERTYPLAEAQAAWRDLVARGRMGKLILIP